MDAVSVGAQLQAACRCSVALLTPDLQVDFSVKLLHWSDNEKVRVQLWDIAGHERFISMTRIYYKGAVGCIVMFDVTCSSSFLNCLHWKQDLDNKAMLPNGGPIPCILLANKCDLSDWVVTAENIEVFCRNHGFITWMETSVKDNKNIEEAMRRLVKDSFSIQSSLDSLQPKTEDCVHPEQEPGSSNSTGASCC
ncbi:Ras- protein Rab-7L1 [Ilyodon furcidens]|uniref:Ras- protein Rab-7L1 n=1 Tax=Ilyodon furcidens TaxID=33524 RepID=A0ABV0TB49_9TELE